MSVVAMIMFNDPSFSDLYIPLHMVNYFLWNAMGFKLLFPLDFSFHTFICVFLVDLYVFVFAMFSRKIVLDTNGLLDCPLLLILLWCQIISITFNLWYWLLSKKFRHWLPLSIRSLIMLNSGFLLGHEKP